MRLAILSAFLPAALLAAVDPASFGFSPDAHPSVNALALQRALDSGERQVEVGKAGTYGLDRTVYVGSHVELTFAPGVVLQKRGEYPHVIVNRGAYEEGARDEDIVIRGLHISCNGSIGAPDPGFVAQNLRGQLAFYKVRNVKVYDFRCVDYPDWRYCVHFCDFEDVLMDGFEIRGRKDGIHFDQGRNFTVRNGVLCTGDDGLAVNAGDWPDCAPVIGTLENGLFEKIRMLKTPDEYWKIGRPGEMGLVIAGVWTDWHPGIRFQRNDVVRAGKNVYAITPMPFTTNEVVSYVMPTHTKGVWESPEGINFLFLKADGSTRADVKNVVYRDIVCEHPKGIRVSWETGDAWARLVHPEVPPEDYPVIDLTFERVKMTAPGAAVVRGAGHCHLKLIDCEANGPLVVLGTKRRPGPVYYPGQQIKVECSGCTFDGGEEPDFAFTGPVKVDVSLKDCKCPHKPKVVAASGADVTVSGHDEANLINETNKQ